MGTPQLQGLCSTLNWFRAGSLRLLQDCPPFCHIPGSRHDMIRLDTLNMRPHQCEEPWKPISGFSETTQLVKVDSAITRPVLIDVQDTHPNSVLFSFGIAEQCSRHEKIMQFLMSGSNEVEGCELDMSMLSSLMGPQALTRNNLYGAGVQPSLIYHPSNEFYAPLPLLELIGDLARRSKIELNADGQVSFTGDSTKLKDILLVVAEHYLSENSTKWRKQSMLIPHFNSISTILSNRLDCIEARANVHESSTVLENMKFAPLKSPEKIKLRPSPKKKTNKKAVRERDLYKKNYFHACECLLSIMMDKKRNGKTAMLSLKKSGPELPQLLMQFSASIAGTGIAVLFSVICKLAYSRVPFCASRLFSTGFGFGLVWLSSAVNRLRDTVVYINKNSGKLNLKEEEMMRKLDRSVKEVFFRAATVMAVAVLRLA
ncbi:uncharacterized protein LOC114270154 isoform X2 [Camellia sinensis]|uniref:uncharacterized protein LOC114270154 isoform X2 n=1 Tax=Camellia sinensis TaxID=4442 RepID=UPI001036D4DD|nr:uncharacterized protein LOC114270154 isoform X2 [Camellia sinensis]